MTRAHELLAALENLLGAWQNEYVDFFGSGSLADFDAVPEVIAARAAIELAKREGVAEDRNQQSNRRG